MEPKQPNSLDLPHQLQTAETLSRHYIDRIVLNPFIVYCQVSLFEAYDVILRCSNGTAAKECSNWNPQGTYKDLTLTIARLAGESTLRDTEQSLNWLERMMES